MWGSHIPAAIINLIAVIETQLSGVAVLDGPTVTEEPLEEAVTVGFTDPDAAEAVTSQVVAEGAAVQPDRELFTIRCAVHVLRGSADITAARVRAYELLAGVGAALAANPTLGRTVMSARIGEANLSQTQVQRGALAEIVFGVDCDAFTRR